MHKVYVFYNYKSLDFYYCLLISQEVCIRIFIYFNKNIFNRVMFNMNIVLNGQYIYSLLKLSKQIRHVWKYRVTGMRKTETYFFSWHSIRAKKHEYLMKNRKCFVRNLNGKTDWFVITLYDFVEIYATIIWFFHVWMKWSDTIWT